MKNKMTREELDTHLLYMIVSCIVDIELMLCEAFELSHEGKMVAKNSVDLLEVLQGEMRKVKKMENKL